MVHGTHFQTDDTAAHNQQALRNGFQLQRIGGIPHAWIFMWNEWQFDWARACRDDRVVEVNHGLAVFAFHFQGVRTGEFTQTVYHFHFTAFGHTRQTAGQLSDNFLFPGTNFVDVGFRLAEDDTVFSQRFGFFDNFRYVQQRFRRDTADVQTNTAEGAVTFYDDGFQT